MIRCRIHQLSQKPASITRPGIFFFLTFIIFSHMGCSSFNCTKLESVLGNSTNLVQFSYSLADHLVLRSNPPLTPRHPDMPVLVTTFVDNNDLQQTSHFGRILQEHMTSRLVQLGYTVREIKLANKIHMEPKSGETILSRNLGLIQDEQQVQAILVGTISRSNRTLYISTRLINPVNSNILATDDYKLCMDSDILTMFGLQLQPSDEQPIEEPQKPFLNSIL